MKLLKDTADIGVWYDCCGKPVSELGLVKEDERGLNALKQRIEKLGVEEIIVLCPNCYHLLKSRLDILGTEESELRFKSIWNRAKHRFF